MKRLINIKLLKEYLINDKMKRIFGKKGVIKAMKNNLMELFSNKRNLVKMLLDFLMIFLSLYIALFFRFDEDFLKYYKFTYIKIYAGVYFLFYIGYKIPNKSWSYINSIDILKIIFVNFMGTLGLFIYYTLTKDQDIYSRRVILLMFLFSTFLQLIGRYLFRVKKTFPVKNNKNSKMERAVIYGAGEAGVGLLRESLSNINFPYKIVGFLDDNSNKIGTYIIDTKVVGNINQCVEKLKELEADIFLIAIPSIKRDKLKEIIEKVKEEIGDEIKIKILPTIDEILTDDNLLNQVRDVKIEDLLGREQVLVNGESINSLINNKTILVTGGAGSIGSELARQILKYSPKELILVDLNENSLYFLELELRGKYKKAKIIPEICNIREIDKVEYLFNKYKPEIVFHAAAHKHVPLMENNPEEAIKNNLFGTKNLVIMADKYEVERFVLISTDKAVNPTNVMGATKRGCELILEDINKKSKTKFMAVRFGNVLGSNGSVIPHFKKLLEEGKNLTITHPDITRYFMTIPEAAQLVIEAGSIGTGGEVFILDMGESIKILDLAKTMIKLSGAQVGIDIVGLREGEKLYEELLYDVNAATKTSNKKIFITKIIEEHTDVDEYLDKFKVAINNPVKEDLKNLLKEFIITYKEPEHHKQ